MTAILTIKLIGYLLMAVLLGGIGTALYLLGVFIDHHG